MIEDMSCYMLSGSNICDVNCLLSRLPERPTAVQSTLVKVDARPREDRGH